MSPFDHHHLTGPASAKLSAASQQSKCKGASASCQQRIQQLRLLALSNLRWLQQGRAHLQAQLLSKWLTPVVEQLIRKPAPSGLPGWALSTAQSGDAPKSFNGLSTLLSSTLLQGTLLAVTSQPTPPMWRLRPAPAAVA